MKIVINSCYGGFGLSMQAVREYLKLKGKEAFFYQQIGYSFEGNESYGRIDNINTDGYLMFYTFTQDFGKTVSKLPEDGWFWDNDIERTDRDLVSVVEKLGEKADGNHAKLSFVDIPDDVKWVISEYDGIETVEEEHRSWN